MRNVHGVVFLHHLRSVTASDVARCHLDERLATLMRELGMPMSKLDAGDYIEMGFTYTLGGLLAVATSPIWIPLWGLGWLYHRVFGVAPSPLRDWD